MGAGLSGTAAVATVTSLNAMFSATNMVAGSGLKQNYMNLTVLYPTFMQYTPNAPGTDRRAWRTSTLRYAALLLTSNLDLQHRTVPPAYDYPGRDFIRWLKWLTWVQMLQPGDATITINSVTSPTTAPAEAILGTLTSALTDTAANPVVFKWLELPHATKMTVTVNKNATVTNPYSISVGSIRSDDIAIPVSDNDEDRQIP
jgi:hypothetical protein